MQNSKKFANAIRFLSIDMIEKAKSGHPGAPMGMADIAYILFKKHLRHNPKNSTWQGRDRFVLSNGHASALLYSLLHLSGYKISKDDLKTFRQYKSTLAGHPEFGLTDGVETTTGPLGQGLANAVGFALNNKILASKFNKENFELFNNTTYCFVGDGCLMEGISHEAASFAGSLNLNNLIVLYDDNKISIDGDVDKYFKDNTKKRFLSYNWDVIADVDGHDFKQIDDALNKAKTNKKPTLIICKTIIGYGSKKHAGKASCHGSPLGDDIKNVREYLDWNLEPFEISSDIYDNFSSIKTKGAQLEKSWQEKLDLYKREFKEDYIELQRRLNNELPSNFLEKTTSYIKDMQQKSNDKATRLASKHSLDHYCKFMPELIGGSADLSESNLTFHENANSIEIDDFSGNYIHYGVREFAMSSIMIGMSLAGGLKTYGATFLVFSDYAKNALRMAALTNQACIFVFTHDSIGLGEDGPTHQPIEQLTALRSIPNLLTFRPADEVETAVSWQIALMQKKPSAIILSRQKLKSMPRNEKTLQKIKKGAYVLFDNSKSNQELDLIIIATGSEIELTSYCFEKLKKHKKLRIISMICSEVYDNQSKEYKEETLPKQIQKRIAIEAASKDFWYKYVGLNGEVIGLDDFGISAPANNAFEHFDLTKEQVLKKIKNYL